MECTQLYDIFLGGYYPGTMPGMHIAVLDDDVDMTDFEVDI